MSARRLIVNADDFGFMSDVNAGIIEAHRRGILTATTLMAGGAAFDDAVRLARENPSLDVGCHLVLVGGKSVAAPGSLLPGTVYELLWKVYGGADRQWIDRELAAQVEKIRAAGIAPSHLDTHKHTHLAPPVLEAVCRIAGRYAIQWVRRPFDLPMNAVAPLATRIINAGLATMRGRFSRTLARYDCHSTDHFAGFQLTGRFGPSSLARVIRSLPDGLTEFMCHPGYCTSGLRQASTRLKESRQRELAALVSAEVRQALAECGVELTDYRSL